MKNIWEYLKALARSVGNIILRYPLAAALTVIVVVGAIILTIFGKPIQIGGILGSLWGKKQPDLRGVPPVERKDETGKPIPPGEPDKNGFVQAPASLTVKDQGLFGDPNTVTIVHPDKGDVKILLPVGVKNKDVKEVVEVKSDVYEVRNHDKGVDTKSILKSLGS